MEQPTSSLEKHPNFIFPDIEKEIGEIERVAKTFNKGTDFTENFIRHAKNTSLSELNDEVWKGLENTDSFDIETGDWNTVEYHASHENRNWKDLKEKFEQGNSIDAPIIMKTGNEYHLVSGNTRLMVSRAAGVKPQVLIVEIN